MAHRSALLLATFSIFAVVADRGAQAGPVSGSEAIAEAAPGFAVVPASTPSVPEIDTEATASPALFSWTGAAAFSSAASNTEPPAIVSLADPSSATLLGGALLALSASAGLRRKR